MPTGKVKIEIAQLAARGCGPHKLVTLMGSGNSFAAGIAFSSAGTLYGSRGNAFGRLEDLDLINPTTGQMTPIGPMETGISDIVFAADGVLYGSSPDGMLYSISPATGMKTALFDTGILSISGLAAIVPEPSSFLLMALGSVLLLILLIRRARNSSTR